MTGEPLTPNPQEKTKALSNGSEPDGALHCSSSKLELTRWAVVGTEREELGPCCLEVNWSLGPGRQKPSLWKGRQGVLPFTFLVGHFGFLWVDEDIHCNDLQITSPVVLGNILVCKAKFSILWTDQSEMNNLLVDLWYLIPANPGDTGDSCSIPTSGRFSGGGNSNPLQYSCQDNPIDIGAWQSTVPGVAKSQTWLSNWAHTRMHTCCLPLFLSAWINAPFRVAIVMGVQEVWFY